MKEMIYKSKDVEIDLLHKGNYKGYDYCIISLQTHPCAYIILDSTHYLYGTHYDEINDVKCHGGFTYSENYLGRDGVEIVSEDEHRWVIGWDYAHFDDQYGEIVDGHEWTTEEIINEVKEVIQQILNNEKKNMRDGLVWD